MKIVGLTGSARSGKDTCANFIRESDGKVLFYAFAEPLKELSRSLFMFSEDQLYGDSKHIKDERWGISPRESWQVIGTNFMQMNIYSYLPHMLDKVPFRQFWTYRFKMFIEEIEKNPEYQDYTVIVTDVRFIHEANVVKELGGKLIKIERPTLNTQNDMYKHCSETEMSAIEADYTIINNKSLEDFKNESLNVYFNL